MSMRRVLTRATFMMLWVVIASTATHADENEDAAQTAMRRGVAAFGEGDAEGALALYEEAKRLVPRANLPYRYAAEALVRLQRYPEAVENLETYLAKKPDVSNAAAVREEIARLRRDHFPGRVHVEANVQNARIAIDGGSQRRAAPLDLLLSPGSHTVDLDADGYQPTQLHITVVGDADLSVTGTLSQVQSTPPVVDHADPPARPAPFPWKTVGYVTAGVGIAALGTAFALDMTALKDKTDEFKTARDAGRSDAVQLKSDTLALRTGVLTTYIAGGVLAAGGIALVLFMPRAESTSGKSGSVWLDVDPLGHRAVISGRF